MSLQFAVLASGSRGNVALVRTDGPGLLIDVGLGPRSLQSRLESVGSSWDEIGAVLLTHVHRDHVGPASLRWLARRGIVLHCHEGHQRRLGRFTGFHILQRQGLTRLYDDRPFLTSSGLRVEPIPLSHDGGPTFGFRLETSPNRLQRSQRVRLGFVTDTGLWTEEMADALAEVDLLGIEFNHDVWLQESSGRSPVLIARNLGPHGHLSNHQGAELLTAVLDRSRPGSIRHVVLLHLSEQCNRAELAIQAAQAALRRARRRSVIHAAEQDRATPSLVLHPVRGRSRRSGSFSPAPARFPWEAA